VAEKAGLALEGTLRGQMITQAGDRRDTLCYAILKQDWRPR
jgi:RimJ/RimL family protein N-acetyltransferase